MCVAWTRALILVFYESDVFYYCENFFPPSQLDFSLCWICRSSTNLIEAMNLLDGTWPSAPGPRIQFWKHDEIIEVPYLLIGKGPNLYQDRWPSKHLTLLGCLVQPGVLEVTLIIPIRSLSIFMIYVKDSLISKINFSWRASFKLKVKKGTFNGVNTASCFFASAWKEKNQTSSNCCFFKE